MKRDAGDAADRDAGASLLFSVADILTNGAKRFPPREEATRVEYRLAGTTEWRPLTAAIEARQYQNNSFLFGGTGTKWRVDLSPATRAFTGFVDLRIHAEDHEGNEVTLRLEPAFSWERTCGGGRRGINAAPHPAFGHLLLARGKKGHRPPLPLAPLAGRGWREAPGEGPRLHPFPHHHPHLLPIRPDVRHVHRVAQQRQRVE